VRGYKHYALYSGYKYFFQQNGKKNSASRMQSTSHILILNIWSFDCLAMWMLIFEHVMGGKCLKDCFMFFMYVGIISML
jgi:hypothetical protein